MKWRGKKSLHRLPTLPSEQEGAVFHISITPALCSDTHSDMRTCSVMIYFFQMFTVMLEMFCSRLR